MTLGDALSRSRRFLPCPCHPQLRYRSQPTPEMKMCTAHIQLVYFQRWPMGSLVWCRPLLVRTMPCRAPSFHLMPLALQQSLLATPLYVYTVHLADLVKLTTISSPPTPPALRSFTTGHSGFSIVCYSIVLALLGW